MNYNSKSDLPNQSNGSSVGAFNVGMQAQAKGCSLRNIVTKIENFTGTKARPGNNGGYNLCCPSHDDKNPSLSITEGDDGKILLKCHAGCTFDEICSAIDIGPAELFPKDDHRSDFEKEMKVFTSYLYLDEYGQELYRKVRTDLGGGEKSFISKRKNDDGTFSFSLKGCRRVLYRLPEALKGVAEGKIIFLVEGEKDADELSNRGLVATTTTITLEWLKEFTEILKNADVVVLYDNDKAGLKRRDRLAIELAGKVRRLRVVDLPGLKYHESHGKDVTDWLNIGNTVVRLLELVENTFDCIAQDRKYGVKVLSVEEFLALELPKREMLMKPFFSKQGLGMLHAKRGVGKTHVALNIAYAIATGGRFLRWNAPEPRRVLYVDGEMPASMMQERLRSICREDTKNFFRYITPDLQDGPMPDLSIKEGRDSIEAVSQDVDLIVVDNLSALFRSGVENEAESWTPAQEWALDLRRKGKSVLFIHHAGKGGMQRGTSKREDMLDFVINLKQPDGYRPEDGASFEINFEKSRHFYGEDAESFCAQLMLDEEDFQKWGYSDVPIDPEVEMIAKLKSQGMTIEQIVEKTGLTKSKVETRLKRGRKKGLCE